MSSATTKLRQSAVVIEIGGVPIRSRCDNAGLSDQIEEGCAHGILILSEKPISVSIGSSEADQ
jgi:hypothetical protein